MKKVVLSLILGLFLVSAMQSQVIEGTSNVGYGNASGDMRFGAKAGFAFSTFTGRDYIDITPKPGFYAGGLVEIPVFFENFYLQPEVVVQLQGADIGSGNLNLLYVHVPLMAKYHITDAIAVELGPQIGVLLADNWDAAIDTKKLNVGLNIGGGYRMDENFYFQLRVSPGFTNVIETTTTKNLSVQLGASYFF